MSVSAESLSAVLVTIRSKSVYQHSATVLVLDYLDSNINIAF